MELKYDRRYSYRLPVPRGNLRRIDRTSSPAHTGKLRYAIDFVVPEDTPVLAAADGIVTYIKDDLSLGGSDVIYWDHSNFVVIMHENGEYSRYDHLAHHSSRVTVGQHVSANHAIAKLGNDRLYIHTTSSFSGICSHRE